MSLTTFQKLLSWRAWRSWRNVQTNVLIKEEYILKNKNKSCPCKKLSVFYNSSLKTFGSHLVFYWSEKNPIILEGWNKNKHSIRAKGLASCLSISSSLLSTQGLLPGVKAEGTWSWPHVHLVLAWRTCAAVSSDPSIVPKFRLDYVLEHNAV